MATVFLIMTSISAAVLQNCLTNKVCKKNLDTDSKINIFNIFVYLACTVTFGILLIGNKLSLFTFLFGAFYGIIAALGQFFKVHALQIGPMNITLLITTSSMIIPTMSGVFFGEKFSFLKLCAVLVLLFFIYLSLQKNEGTRFNKKWIFCCVLAFLAIGVDGVIQKIHQKSQFRFEVSGFLFVAFAFAVLFNLISNKGIDTKQKLPRSIVLFALICGGCTFAMNFINLKLVGMLPSQLFFPVVNGSAIVLSTIMSVLIFKEDLTKRRTIGLIGGIASLIAICLVP